MLLCLLLYVSTEYFCVQASMWWGTNDDEDGSGVGGGSIVGVGNGGGCLVLLLHLWRCNDFQAHIIYVQPPKTTSFTPNPHKLYYSYLSLRRSRSLACSFSTLAEAKWRHIRDTEFSLHFGICFICILIVWQSFASSSTFVCTIHI